MANMVKENHLVWRLDTARTEIDRIYDTVIDNDALTRKKFPETTCNDILNKFGEEILKAASKCPPPKSKKHGRINNVKDTTAERNTDPDEKSESSRHSTCEDGDGDEWFMHPLVDDIINSHALIYGEDWDSASLCCETCSRTEESGEQNLSNATYTFPAGTSVEGNISSSNVLTYSNPFDPNLKFDGIFHPRAHKATEAETSEPVNLFLGLPNVSKMLEDHTSRYRVYLSALTTQYKQQNDKLKLSFLDNAPENLEETEPESDSEEVSDDLQSDNQTDNKTNIDAIKCDPTDTTTESKEVAIYGCKVLNDKIKNIWDLSINEFVPPYSKGKKCTAWKNRSVKDPLQAIIDGSTLKFVAALDSPSSEIDNDEIWVPRSGADTDDLSPEDDLLKQCNGTPASRAESSEDEVSDMSDGQQSSCKASPGSYDLPLLIPSDRAEVLANTTIQATLQNKCQTVNSVHGSIPAMATRASRNLPVRRRLWDDKGTTLTKLESEVYSPDRPTTTGSSYFRQNNAEPNVHKSPAQQKGSSNHNNGFSTDKIKSEFLHPATSVNRLTGLCTNAQMSRPVWALSNPAIQLGQPVTPQWTPTHQLPLTYPLQQSYYGNRGPTLLANPTPRTLQANVTNPIYMEPTFRLPYNSQVHRPRPPVLVPTVTTGLGHQPYPTQAYPPAFSNNPAEPKANPPNVFNSLFTMQEQNQPGLLDTTTETAGLLTYFPSAYPQAPPNFQPCSESVNPRHGLKQTSYHHSQSLSQTAWTTTQNQSNQFSGGFTRRQQPVMPVQKSQLPQFLQQILHQQRQPVPPQPHYVGTSYPRPPPLTSFDGFSQQRPTFISQHEQSNTYLTSKTAHVFPSQSGLTTFEQPCFSRSNFQRPLKVTQPCIDRGFLQRFYERNNIQRPALPTTQIPRNLSKINQDQQKFGTGVSNSLIDLVAKQQHRLQVQKEVNPSLRQQAHQLHNEQQLIWPPLPVTHSFQAPRGIPQLSNTQFTPDIMTSNIKQQNAQMTCLNSTLAFNASPRHDHWGVQVPQTQPPALNVSSQLNPTAKPFSGFASAFKPYSSSASENHHQAHSNLIQVPIYDNHELEQYEDQLPPWRRNKTSKHSFKPIQESDEAGLTDGQTMPANTKPAILETGSESYSWESFRDLHLAATSGGTPLKHPVSPIDHKKLEQVHLNNLDKYTPSKLMETGKKGNSSSKFSTPDKEFSGEDEISSPCSSRSTEMTTPKKKATVSVRKYFPAEQKAQRWTKGNMSRAVANDGLGDCWSPDNSLATKNGDIHCSSSNTTSRQHTSIVQKTN